MPCMAFAHSSLLSHINEYISALFKKKFKFFYVYIYKRNKLYLLLVLFLFLITYFWLHIKVYEFARRGQLIAMINLAMGFFFNFATVCAMAVCFFSLMSSMYTNIHEQTHEIGIMQALGMGCVCLCFCFVFVSFFFFTCNLYAHVRLRIFLHNNITITFGTGLPVSWLRRIYIYEAFVLIITASLYVFSYRISSPMQTYTNAVKRPGAALTHALNNERHTHTHTYVISHLIALQNGHCSGHNGGVESCAAASDAARHPPPLLLPVDHTGGGVSICNCVRGDILACANQ